MRYLLAMLTGFAASGVYLYFSIVSEQALDFAAAGKVAAAGFGVFTGILLAVQIALSTDTELGKLAHERLSLIAALFFAIFFAGETGYDAFNALAANSADTTQPSG